MSLKSAQLRGEQAVNEIITILRSLGKNISQMDDDLIMIRDTLARKIDNCNLQYHFNKSICDKFDNIDDAIQNYVDDTKILVHISGIDKYGIFTVGDYGTFITNFTNSPEFDESKANSIFSQIILTDKKQKMVFMYTGNSVDTIKKLASDFFKCDLSTFSPYSSIEIVVNSGMYENFKDVSEKFLLFYDYVRNMDFAESCNILPPMIHKSRNSSFFRKKIPITCRNNDSLSKILTNYSQNLINNNINANTENVGEFVDENIICTNDKQAVAKKWIENNSPEGIITTTYYETYAKSVENPMYNTKFGPLVTKCGFVTKHKKEGRYWTKTDLPAFISTISPTTLTISSTTPSPKKNYSKKQIVWLNFIANEFEIDIRHAENSPSEHKIVDDDLNKTYYVDGFCEVNDRKIAFEFDGCYWHGCPKCNNLLDNNTKSKKQYGDLYEKTFNRRSSLVRLGYVVVKIRECKYDRIFGKKGFDNYELCEWIDKVWHKIYDK